MIGEPILLVKEKLVILFLTAEYTTRNKKKYMDATGIEPMTSSLQGKRATNCAMCPQKTYTTI